MCGCERKYEDEAWSLEEMEMEGWLTVTTVSDFEERDSNQINVLSAILARRSVFG